MAVAAATGGTRAPAVREEASARPLGGGGRGKQRRDFERGSVVEVVVAEVVGGRGGTVSWRKRWQGVESESRGEEKEKAVGPGGGLPSYRRDPAKILRDLSLLLQVGLAYFSGAFDQVLRSRKIERGEMANRQT